MTDKPKAPLAKCDFIVEPLILPAGKFAASVRWNRPGPRGGKERPERFGDMVIADTPVSALNDLILALRGDHLDFRLEPTP